MKLVWLAWYLSGMSALMFLLCSLISWAHDAQTVAAIMHIVFACGVFLGASAAVWLGRLPPQHWVHQSKPIWAMFVTAAVGVTLLVVCVG